MFFFRHPQPVVDRKAVAVKIVVQQTPQPAVTLAQAAPVAQAMPMAQAVPVVQAAPIAPVAPLSAALPPNRPARR